MANPKSTAKENRARAARQNSKKSTGPKTKRGKLVASRNGVKHGLCATQPPLLQQEEREQFEARYADLVDTYHPVGPLEEQCILQIAICLHKRQRAWAAEYAAMTLQSLPDPLPPAEPEPALTTQQQQAKSLLIGLLERSGNCPTEKEFDAERTALSNEQLMQEREEAEPDSCDWLETWPPRWEEEPMLEHDLLQALVVFLKEYPTELLPIAVPDPPTPFFSSAKERQAYIVKRQWVIDQLATLYHPYGLAERCFQKLQSFQADHQSNAYAEIERVPIDQLSPSTIRAEIERIETIWKEHPDRRWTHSQATELMQWITDLRQSVQLAIEGYRQIEADHQQRQEQQQALATQRADLAKRTLPEQIQLISRYETHIDHQLQRAIDTLCNLQDRRQKQAIDLA